MVRAFLHGISVATVLLFVLLTWSRDAAAGNLAGLIGQVERGIEEVEAPEEIQEEARRLLRKAGETAVSSTAVELIVRVAFGLVGVHFR